MHADTPTPATPGPGPARVTVYDVDGLAAGLQVHTRRSLDTANALARLLTRAAAAGVLRGRALRRLRRRANRARAAAQRATLRAASLRDLVYELADETRRGEGR